MQLKTETKVGLFVIIAIGIFAYMALYLGVLRFHLRDYTPYFVYFESTDGLSKKADIKIAGVKVGWVENIELVEDNLRAKIKIMIMSKYTIYNNAYAEIRQEGFLGTKYLEIVPGTPNTFILNPGSTLGKISRSPVSIENLMQKFESIANNIEEASSKIAYFSDVLSRNERNIEAIIHNINAFTNDLAPVGKDIHLLTQQLNSDIFPSLQSNIQKISNTFEKNFDKVANRIDSTMQHIGSVAQKVNDGNGLIGKLINETDVYDDIKVIASGFKDMTKFGDNISVIFDSHFESMYRPAEHYRHKDAKGYLDLRFHTKEDLFYLFQIVGSEKGTLRRTSLRNKFYNEHGRILTEQDIAKLPDTFAFPPFRTDSNLIIRNSTKYGFQIGKIYRDLAFRFGIFENAFGVGVDYEMPICDENFRWVTSLEAFDFRGQDRINDRRPHLKWINRVFFLRNLYVNFGADDFISKKNANAFFGCGLRFSDDDIKYVIGKLGFLTNGALSVMN